MAGQPLAGRDAVVDSQFQGVPAVDALSGISWMIQCVKWNTKSEYFPLGGGGRHIPSSGGIRPE